jgi:hypothetical protein
MAVFSTIYVVHRKATYRMYLPKIHNENLFPVHHITNGGWVTLTNKTKCSVDIFLQIKDCDERPPYIQVHRLDHHYHGKCHHPLCQSMHFWQHSLTMYRHKALNPTLKRNFSTDIYLTWATYQGCKMAILIGVALVPIIHSTDWQSYI